MYTLLDTTQSQNSLVYGWADPFETVTDVPAGMIEDLCICAPELENYQAISLLRVFSDETGVYLEFGIINTDTDGVMQVLGTVFANKVGTYTMDSADSDTAAVITIGLIPTNKLDIKRHIKIYSGCITATRRVENTEYNVLKIEDAGGTVTDEIPLIADYTLLLDPGINCAVAGGTVTAKPAVENKSNITVGPAYGLYSVNGVCGSTLHIDIKLQGATICKGTNESDRVIFIGRTRSFIDTIDETLSPVILNSAVKFPTSKAWDNSGVRRADSLLFAGSGVGINDRYAFNYDKTYDSITEVGPFSMTFTSGIEVYSKDAPVVSFSTLSTTMDKDSYMAGGTTTLTGVTFSSAQLLNVVPLIGGTFVDIAGETTSTSEVTVEGQKYINGKELAHNTSYSPVDLKIVNNFGAAGSFGTANNTGYIPPGGVITDAVINSISAISDTSDINIYSANVAQDSEIGAITIIGGTVSVGGTTIIGGTTSIVPTSYNIAESTKVDIRDAILSGGTIVGGTVTAEETGQSTVYAAFADSISFSDTAISGGSITRVLRTIITQEPPVNIGGGTVTILQNVTIAQNGYELNNVVASSVVATNATFIGGTILGGVPTIASLEGLTISAGTISNIGGRIEHSAVE